MKTIRALPIPVIAAVNGVAAGAGCNFALACDLVIATEAQACCNRSASSGLIPDTRRFVLPAAVIGHQRAMGLALLGDKDRARRAAELGQSGECVAQADRIDCTA